MRLDLYRRPEAGGRYSYLVVPEGRPIPEEANSIDWQLAGEGVEMSDDAQPLAEYSIEQAFSQLDSKGYAITSSRYLSG